MNKRIEQLSIGMKRLLLVISLIMPFICAAVFEKGNLNLLNALFSKYFFQALVYFAFVFLVFWAIIRVLLWIYDGFFDN